MKIRMVSQAFTQLGLFERGQVLQTGDKFSEAFLLHLVNACGAAEIIEVKVVQPVTEIKIEIGDQLSENQIDQVLDRINDRSGESSVIIKKDSAQSKAITSDKIPAKKKRGRPKKLS